MNVACPFCAHDANSLRGEGCCFCDWTGLIPKEERDRILDPNANNTEEYPFLSNHDLKAGRQILKDREKDAENQ